LILLSCRLSFQNATDRYPTFAIQALVPGHWQRAI
jgi:hypothetical protein